MAQVAQASLVALNAHPASMHWVGEAVFNVQVEHIKLLHAQLSRILAVACRAGSESVNSTCAASSLTPK